MYKWVVIFLCSSGFAASIDATFTNYLSQDLVVMSDTSLADISPRFLPAKTKNNFYIKFNSQGTKRGSFSFYDKEHKVLKRILVVIDGAHNVTTLVCVPIASCKNDNPRISNNHLYFLIN